MPVQRSVTRRGGPPAGWPVLARRRPRRAASSAGGAVAAALVCGLLAALLLQTLGLVHAVVHRNGQGPLPRGVAWATVDRLAAQTTAERRRAVARPAAAAAAAAWPGPSVQPAGGWADALFAGHDAGSSACALYDQLVQPVLAVDTACVANPAFAPPLPGEPPRVGRLAAQAVGFLARGPPPALPAASAQAFSA